MTDIRIMTWDHRGQPDISELATHVADLSGGRMLVTPIDTGTDDYAIALSAGPPISVEAVQQAWERHWRGEDERHEEHRA